MKKLTACLAISLMIFNHPVQADDNPLAKALTSHLAFIVYASVLSGVGTYVAQTGLEPLYAQYRKLTGTENYKDLAKKAQVKEKEIILRRAEIELDKIDFVIQIEKLKALGDHLPTYQASMARTIQRIQENNLPEDERKRAIALHEAQLKKTTEDVDHANIKNYESLIALTKSGIKKYEQKHKIPHFQVNPNDIAAAIE